MAAIHDRHDHEQYRQGQGDRGHRWSDYQRQARQINAYARAVAMQRIARCSDDGWCAVSLAAYLYRAPAGLMHAIAECESGHRVTAQNSSSSAAGLFQWISSSWRTASADIGHPGASVFNGLLNASAAAHRINVAGTGDWAASASCWN